jgi:hypothetical protein
LDHADPTQGPKEPPGFVFNAPWPHAVRAPTTNRFPLAARLGQPTGIKNALAFA